MPRFLSSPFGRLTAVLLALALCLLGAQAAQAGSAPTAARGADRAVPVTAGELTSKVVGTTANGRRVTGTFTPRKFVRRDGKVLVRGVLDGVVHNKSGSTRTFSTVKTMRVKSINGTPAKVARSSSAALATCDILHLVLAPLDLDLLGLVVHLDRVVLDIVAVSGAGALLGNLLCAVTGLLDGGLGGLLGRLVLLLNQILSILRPGL